MQSQVWRLTEDCVTIYKKRALIMGIASVLCVESP